MKSAIMRMKKSCVIKGQPTDIDRRIANYERELKKLTSEIGHLCGMARGLTTMESAAREKIEREVQARKDPKHAAERELKHAKRVKALSADYNRLSLEGFKWRNSEGWPELAIFQVGGSGFFSLGVDDNAHIYLAPEVFAEVSEQYTDLIPKLLGNRVRLSARFDGMIPPEIREKIRTVEREGKFDKLYIIAEVSEWNLASVAPSRQGDPLLVGSDGRNLWLIADFDVTPIEAAFIFESPGDPK